VDDHELATRRPEHGIDHKLGVLSGHFLLLSQSLDHACIAVVLVATSHRTSGEHLVRNWRKCGHYVSVPSSSDTFAALDSSQSPLTSTGVELLTTLPLPS
jgi:hypothetical protein